MKRPAFRTVARLVLEQVQKLDGTVKGLIDIGAIDDALTGKGPYAREHKKTAAASVGSAPARARTGLLSISMGTQQDASDMTYSAGAATAGHK
jgi:hypothetical protein